MTATGQSGAGEILAPAAPADLEPLTAPPTFSVVIPAYQVAETIAVAVRSAFDQAHPAHEVIVVDDGSTDDLAGALRPFEGRIELIRKENGGVASARNAGAEVASGDFMAVLDADDRYHPRRLEALAELASQRPDLDLVTTDARFVVGGEGEGSYLAANPFDTADQRAAILRSCFVGGWPAVRISRLREIGGFDEDLHVGVDWDCWLRLILAGSRAGLVARPYYDYVLHPGTVTSNRERSLWGRVTLLEKAARNSDLKPAERPLLRRELRRRRSDAIGEETRAALAGERPGWRLLGRAILPGVEPRVRLGAALAPLFPALARRLAPGRGRLEERLHGHGR